jgi:hypothetical protein
MEKLMAPPAARQSTFSLFSKHCCASTFDFSKSEIMLIAISLMGGKQTLANIIIIKLKNIPIAEAWRLQ